MNTRNIILLFCFASALSLIAQKKVSTINDLAVTLHEETVNKVLLALGEINGASDYEALMIKGTYTWTVKNPKINIRPDSSFFTCDAIVKTGPFEYKSNVVGNVKIVYDSNQNKLFIKISRAIFELYTYLFGKKIHIKDIHLEEHFKEPFAFEGPRTITSTMDFMMPDSTVKKIAIQPTDCKMEVKWKEICTACEIKVSEWQPIPVIKNKDVVDSLGRKLR